MKASLIRCDECNEITRHLTTKKISTTKSGYRTKRTVKHRGKAGGNNENTNRNDA